jgi:hypothetical protein
MKKTRHYDILSYYIGQNVRKKLRDILPNKVNHSVTQMVTTHIFSKCWEQITDQHINLLIRNVRL